ncbi:hypothetical protein BKA66DRAFT_613929 [Pyrenochaeta sp. MPI-SDFR-AT-0127]|nr:hypothetical protein BKA66DRAFT_613929 [Pyrenochaeta sp. MPI-SDFR-AT-0127]
MPVPAGTIMAGSDSGARTNVSPREGTPIQFHPPMRCGHHIQNQQVSGRATVHNGDVYNFVLPEDVAKEAASLSSAIAMAGTACKELYELISHAQNVPIDIYSISRDLEDLYVVTGTVQALLVDEEFTESIIWAALSGNLANVVESSLSVFADITARVKDLELDKNKEMNTGKAGKEPLREGLRKEEVEALRKCLTSHKITLNIAISMASLYQTYLTHDAISEYQARLEAVLQAIEDEKAVQLPPSKPHRDIDRATVRVDKTYALRHYLSSAASVLSEATMRPVPSMQVSSYLESESFGESQTFITAPTTLGSMKCSQIFITGLPNKRTVILQVTPLHTIESVKYQIRKKLDLPNASFQFTYRNRVLHKPNDTLESYSVLHDSTLVCVSFRLDRSRPGVWSQSYISSVTIKFLTRSVELQFDTNEEILMGDVKAKLNSLEGTDPDKVRLIHRGKILDDDLPLTAKNFDVYDGKCTIHAVLRLSKRSTQPDQDDNQFQVPTLRQGQQPRLSALRGRRRVQPFSRLTALETVEEVSTAGDSDRTSDGTSEYYIVKDDTFNQGRGSVREYLSRLRWFRKTRQ